MKEHAATIQEPDHLSTKSFAQATIGQTCKLMPRHMSRSVINANDLVTSLDNHQSILSL